MRIKFMARSSPPLSVIVSAALGIIALVLVVAHIHAASRINYNQTGVNPGGPCIGLNGQLCGAPNQTNATVAVNLEQEMNNTSQNGIILNASVFSSNYPAYCTLIQIGQCNNNEPSQFICVNSQFAGQVESDYS